MKDHSDPDAVEFDDLVTVALAHSVEAAAPSPDLKRRLLAQIHTPVVPAGFMFRLAQDDDWVAHPVPGIRMKMLAMNRAQNYAAFLLEVAPNTRFPEHFHAGPEECYVISGTVYTCDRRMGPGDFLHADANTNHGELWTDEGCRVLLVQAPEDYMPDPA